MWYFAIEEMKYCIDKVFYGFKVIVATNEAPRSETVNMYTIC